MQKKSGLILFFLNEVKEFKENESDAEMVIMVVNYYQAKGVEVMNSARKFLMKGFMVRKKCYRYLRGDYEVGVEREQEHERLIAELKKRL